MSQKRAPSRDHVEEWSRWAKASQPQYVGGPALTEWRAEKARCINNLEKHGLDLDGNLTDWARAEGYKEPK